MIVTKALYKLQAGLPVNLWLGCIQTTGLTQSDKIGYYRVINRVYEPKLCSTTMFPYPTT